MTKEAATESKEPLVNVKRENYKTSVSASGSKSLTNGDEVATLIEGMEVDELYDIAEKFLSFPCKVRGEVINDVDELEKAYDSLNVGMQRMNLGNRFRGQVSKLDTALEKAEAEAAKEDGKPVPKSMKGGMETLEKIAAPFVKARDKRIEEEAKAKAAKAAEAKKAEAAPKKKAAKKAA